MRVVRFIFRLRSQRNLHGKLFVGRHKAFFLTVEILVGGAVLLPRLGRLALSFHLLLLRLGEFGKCRTGTTDATTWVEDDEHDQSDEHGTGIKHIFGPLVSDEVVVGAGSLSVLDQAIDDTDLERTKLVYAANAENWDQAFMGLTYGDAKQSRVDRVEQPSPRH